MSCTKRYLDDLYWDKIYNHTDEELIKQGMDPDLIEYVRYLFESEED